MSISSVVYVSSTKQEMSDEDLKSLLAQSRRNNEWLNITGMLLYRDRFFMQALEGSVDDVENLFNVIAKDTRHDNVLIIDKSTLPKRNFPDWQMGFNKIDDSVVEGIEGYSDFLKNSKPEFFINSIKNSPSEIEILLNKFKYQLLL